MAHPTVHGRRYEPLTPAELRKERAAYLKRMAERATIKTPSKRASKERPGMQNIRIVSRKERESYDSDYVPPDWVHLEHSKTK